MALNYTDLFTDLGKLVKYYDAFKTTASGLDAALQAILDAFQNGDQDLAIEGLANSYEGFKAEYTGRRGSLAQYAAKRLQDRTTVLDEIIANSTDINVILARLHEKMIADSQTIKASVVALGSVTANAGNTGNGTVLLTSTLDGITSPGGASGQTYPPHPGYKGQLTQLCVPSDTIEVRCTADVGADGTTEGSEQFGCRGLTAVGAHAVGVEGSGQLTGLTCLHSATLLQNRDFEDFGTNVPTTWTLDAGTAGTHCFQDVSAGDFYHALSAVEFRGDGAQASVQLSQAPSTLIANKRYALALRYKASATIAAGTFTVQFEGTGYAAGATEKISIAPASLATAWTLASFFVNMPDQVPSDFKLVIKWTGTPTVAKSLWFDDLAFGPVDFMAGFGLVQVRGSIPNVRDDHWTFTVANTEGVFQRAFRRIFGKQLASNAAGGETIVDSLAT